MAGVTVALFLSLPENAWGWMGLKGIWLQAGWAVSRKKYWVGWHSLVPLNPCLPGPLPSDLAYPFSSSSAGEPTGLMGPAGILEYGPQDSPRMGEAIVWPYAPEVRGLHGEVGRGGNVDSHILPSWAA